MQEKTISMNLLHDIKSGKGSSLIIILCILLIWTERSDGARFHPRHPVETPGGIVFTDENLDAIYIARSPASGSTTAEELYAGPGCGRYFTVSPDGKEVGFKEIFPDGMQAPALLNLTTAAVTLLHSPVPLCGQIAFSPNGEMAYSIADDVFITSVNSTMEIPIGLYSNVVSLSSDGRRIAFVDGNGSVYIEDIDSRLRQSVSGAGHMMPLWSRVGERLCYSGLDGKVYVFDLANGENFSLGNGFQPVWTADGSSLIVVRREIVNQSLVNSDIYDLSFDGSRETQLTRTKDVFETDPSVDIHGSVLFGAYNNDSIYVGSTVENQKSAISVQPVQNPMMPGVKSRIETDQHFHSPPHSSAYLEVPYTNQVYDTPYGFGGLGSTACGPTSAIMVISYYDLLPEWDCALVTPQKHTSYYGNYVLEPYHFHGVYFSGSPNSGGYGYMWNSNDPYHTMVSYYKYHGLDASELDNPPFDTVTAEVTGGHPYTLCNGLTTAGHIIVIIGVGDKEGTVIANDPYGNKNSGTYPNWYGKDVPYDWPGYNNGNENLTDVFWGVSVRYTPPAFSDSVVDDLQFGDGFTMKNSSPASMTLWLDRTSGFDGHEWYTTTRKSDTCTATWRPVLSKSGNYEVFAYIYYSTAKAAKYWIHYAGDSTVVVLNQSQFRDSWASLGTFPFLMGDSGYVTLGDGSDSTGQMIVFDATRWSYRSPTLVTGNPSLPDRMTLLQNYPNPFNPSTEISYSLSATGHVTLKIYDVLGREVATLVNEKQGAGAHTVRFDGSRLSSGVYFYRLNAGDFVATKKLVLTK